MKSHVFCNPTLNNKKEIAIYHTTEKPHIGAIFIEIDNIKLLSYEEVIKKHASKKCS